MESRKTQRQSEGRAEKEQRNSKERAEKEQGETAEGDKCSVLDRRPRETWCT